ncbi:MAG: rod shape-determining protein MreD [Firmicutes bacterium]|nr:rod shape-determining protein MreD [Bacillota bacterium]
MSFKRVLILFILAFLMQMSVVNLISFRNMGPDLIMCLMIAITFLYDDGYRSIPFALFFGLLLDVCAHQFVGVTPMIYLVVGIFAAACRIWLNAEKMTTLAVTGVIATFIYETLYFAFMKLLGNPLGAGFILLKEPVFMIYNVAILALLFLAMHKKAEQYHNDRYQV